MGHKFADIVFTDAVRETQRLQGSRSAYSRLDSDVDSNHLLGEDEAEFIVDRDSFYMASISETGWPYVQHRGDPAGFIKVVDEKTLTFADFAGNRQYVSAGNFTKDDRVSLFFMDYLNRRRLKLLGTVSVIDPGNSKLLASLENNNYRARVEWGFVIHIEAFDWNCPQHITPRYTKTQVEALISSLLVENKELKNKVKVK
jgi:predicted pyridoxine 5'-phosphate oxidase superfamily flavin-nucleotide-binding protein